MNTNSGDQLKAAAQTGDIDLLYTVIHHDPWILEIIDSIPFVETPLHIAASLGHIRFALEIMKLKPSLALKLNPQGFSPVHLAMQNDQKRMLFRFVYMKNDLVRIEGREGLTLVHFASQIGELELLAEFLTACPDSIKDVTVKGETALHIAVKNDQYEAFDLLVFFLRKNFMRNARMIQDKILNWKDEDDNTILHILAQRNFEPQVVKALGLLLKIGINLKAKNLENKTALDMAANADIRSILLCAGAKSNSQITDAPTLAHKLKSNITIRDKMATFIRRVRKNISEEERNSWLIAATLVATAMYQSALSPPGGIYQVSASDDNHVNNTMTSSWWNSTNISTNAGHSILSGPEFSVFLIFNMSSFFLSVIAIIIMIPRGVIGSLVAAPVTSFAFSYIYSMFRISPTLDNVLTILIIFLLILFTPCIELFLRIYDDLKSVIVKKLNR
ncbi:ankyrin repeat-containing protein BDA1-like [Vicia villosa]|uniref:ankyrin repeat-containing protein BDA1-like n=1 Tax=Vicia villosa TaxID=3911 RepID=UPI00273AF1AF|nr:ankyrin repeat-containing protein BDA1-like [Vicia villosa]